MPAHLILHAIIVIFMYYLCIIIIIIIQYFSFILVLFSTRDIRYYHDVI